MFLFFANLSFLTILLTVFIFFKNGHILIMITIYIYPKEENNGPPSL